MRKDKSLASKAATWLLLTIFASACTDNVTNNDASLPEGKYPLEFTSQMYGMEVTRATSANSWDGGEQIALRVTGSDTRKYQVSDKTTGAITAASGVTPFYWTSTGETKTVSAYYPYALAEASTIEIKSDQSDNDNYQASDALYAAPTEFAFTAETKSLTFRHLPARVVANLKAGDGVTEDEVQGATVKFVSQSLSASFDNTTGAVTAASTGSDAVIPNAITTTASGYHKSVQALLVPCQMQNEQFIAVTLGSDTFHYTPTTDTDGNLESGKGYTYAITVKRDGIEVELTESDAWTAGGSEDVQSSELSMKFTIDLTGQSTLSYILPFNTSGSTGAYTLTVDWGDGSTTTINPNTKLSTAISCTYSNASEYTITITTTQPDFSKEQIPGFKPGYNRGTTNNNNKKLKSVDTPLLYCGNSNLSYCFTGCINLTSIPANLFVNYPEVTTFASCFYGCTGLTAIPAGLFATNTEVEIFVTCFYGCTGLTAIPTGLFAANTEVTTFESCFNGCTKLSGTIPELLFATNSAVTTFNSCFSGCSKLSGTIPTGLFANNAEVETFAYCFHGCTSLTGEIPTNLFATNSAVTTFANCFYGCTGLTAIPTGLFANNAEVETFASCFRGCTSLTGSIPTNLFANNSAVTTFGYCFYGCTGLTAIPTGLFANNAEVETFESCFNGCKGLTGAIPTGLFATNTEVTTFESCFRGCTKLSESIPAGLFDNNTEVTTFASCFNGCTGLSTIPSSLFANNIAVTTFEKCFSGCTGLTGLIPEGLFTYNTKVAIFVGTFSSCTSLSGSIPELLFATNSAVTTFNSCFSGCTKLTLNSNIFCNEAADKSTRFLGKTVLFSSCFQSVGSHESVTDAGTAPALWEYEGVPKVRCFIGIGTVSNATSIPDDWK